MDKGIAGYRTEHGDYEMLYAVTEDGQVYGSSSARRPNPRFDDPDRVWIRLVALPGTATFMGHYDAPRGVV